MNTQSTATQKWQAKAGYMTKNFKLKRDLVEQFTEACQANGESQAQAISTFMADYISRTRRES